MTRLLQRRSSLSVISVAQCEKTILDNVHVTRNLNILKQSCRPFIFIPSKYTPSLNLAESVAAFKADTIP